MLGKPLVSYVSELSKSALFQPGPVFFYLRYNIGIMPKNGLLIRYRLNKRFLFRMWRRIHCVAEWRGLECTSKVRSFPIRMIYIVFQMRNACLSLSDLVCYIPCIYPYVMARWRSKNLCDLQKLYQTWPDKSTTYTRFRATLPTQSFLSRIFKFFGASSHNVTSFPYPSRKRTVPVSELQVPKRACCYQRCRPNLAFFLDLLRKYYIP